MIFSIAHSWYSRKVLNLKGIKRWGLGNAGSPTAATTLAAAPPTTAVRAPRKKVRLLNSFTTPSKEGDCDERPHDSERHERQPGYSLEFSHGTSLFLKSMAAGRFSVRL